MSWRCFVLLAALSLLVRPVEARPPNSQEARALCAETRSLIDAGKYDDAIDRGEKALAIRKRLRRGNHAEVAESLDLLGEAYVHKNDFPRAEELLGRRCCFRGSPSPERTIATRPAC